MSLPGLLIGDWQAAPVLDGLAVLYGLLYVLATRRIRGGWPLRRTIPFLGGVATVVVALQSGYGTWDARLLSAHMVQHMLLLLVAPALLLAGRPLQLLLRTLPAHRRPAVARRVGAVRGLGSPLACLTAFAAVTVLTHLPGFYSATLTHPVLHDAEHLLYVLAGMLMWWPILGDEPLPSARLGGLGMLVYLLATMAPMALVGAVLNRHAALVYPAYAAPAHAAGISALADQAQAGAVMWVGGNTIVIAVGLWAILAVMVGEERRLAAREARVRAAGGTG
jgi:putative copper resistance protein D